MEMKVIENGIRSVANAKKRKRRRRNPTTTTVKAANPRRRRRRRNGVSVMAKAANPRRRRRASRRRSNGLFGDTKATTKAVVSLMAGMGATKVVGGLVSPFLSKLLVQVGMGNFSQTVAEGAVSVLVVAPIARKVAGNDAGKFAMLGGLAMTAFGVVDMFLPDSIPLNPFAVVNTQPIVIPTGSVAAVSSGNTMAGANYVNPVAYQPVM